MKKLLRYVLLLIVFGIAAYKSVYFKKLSEVKASGKTFNAATYAQTLYSKLPAIADKAITLDQLLADLKSNKEKAFADNGRAMAIGSTRFFMVKDSGVVATVNESGVDVITNEHNELSITTEFVYGNAIRDASALVNLNDFNNSTDLNNISSEIDKIIREKVLPPFKSTVKKGDLVSFEGMVELNSEHLNLNDIELIPIKLTITK